MSGRNSNKLATYRFNALAVWQSKLPNVKGAVLPPSNNRPNPLVTDTAVFASIFAPGAVCALQRETGELLWRRELAGLGDAAVYKAGGILFAKTPHTLYAMDPDSGQILWTFCPYGTSGETMYSSPTVHGQSVFIGDRRGFLHCLDLRTGKTKWRQHTSKAKNNDVNSTPLVHGGLVIVATNANRAVAYDPQTGELAWISRLDGPAVRGPLVFQRLVAAFTDSIYLLEPKTGKAVRTFSWKGDGINGATSTPKNIVGTLRGKWPPDGGTELVTELVAVNSTRIQFSVVHNGWISFVRYVRETKLVYMSHLDGIYACCPTDGRLIWNIKLAERRPEGVGLVEVKNNTIYALTGTGHVFALRHP
jgi:outer membrane protein assembly factor BamB